MRFWNDFGREFDATPIDAIRYDEDTVFRVKMPQHFRLGYPCQVVFEAGDYDVYDDDTVHIRFNCF